jgi:hypothetical protein
MLSAQSLSGDQTTIEPELITMRYGTGRPPSGGATSVILEADRQQTDVEKATFAHAGQSRRRIRRPFYEQDAEISEKVIRETAEGLDRYIQQHPHRV